MILILDPSPQLPSQYDGKRNTDIYAHYAPRRAVRNKLVVYCVYMPARVPICLTASKELNILVEEGLQYCECH